MQFLQEHVAALDEHCVGCCDGKREELEDIISFNFYALC